MVLSALGFKQALITSIDKPRLSIYPFKKENAQSLSFKNNIFDTVIVHDGLHHCQMPHMALLEMYRVARKKVILFEAQDTFFVRFLTSLNLIPEYEITAIDSSGSKGGVNNTGSANYIYRWSRREIFKLLSSFDYSSPPILDFHSQFTFHNVLINNLSPIKKYYYLNRPSKLFFRKTEDLLNSLIPQQGNNFCCLITKRGPRSNSF